jgi:uncharacterized tellurite resistance protein B-like protein
MEDYAEELLKYGKKEKLISLYEQMIDLSACFPGKRNLFMEKLNSVLIADPSTAEYEDKLSEKITFKNNPELI